MAEENMKLTKITNPRARNNVFKRRMKGLKKKAEELTALCGLDACLTFFNPDDNKLVAWPSPEVAKSLMDRFYSVPSFERAMRAENHVSFLMTEIQKVQKKLVACRKRVAKLKRKDLISQLENGRRFDDISLPETESLISYTKEKIMGLNKKLGYPEHAFTSVNMPFLNDETPREEHSDETHVSTMAHGFDLNMKPSDDEEDMSSGASDA